MSYCCVKSCGHNKNKYSCRYHRFPSDPKTCTAWVQVVGEEDFLYLNNEILHQKKYVCSCHFVDENYSSSLKMHLKSAAVPSIFNEKTVSISDESMKTFLSPQMIVPTISVVTPLSNIENLHIVEYQPETRKRKSTDLNTTEETPIKRTRPSEIAEESKKRVMRCTAINSMTEYKSVNTVQILKSKQPLILKPCSLIKILDENLKAMNFSSAQELILNIELLLNNYKNQIKSLLSIQPRKNLSKMLEYLAQKLHMKYPLY
ncbi:uncharacterized protein LOC130670966 isoform X2 [Microplitis mediator]|uniref:uncharacterized protein LOC130665689 isoform X3 n=1 Tax=Microplitis mediator TaxID=375433 RepID=UPI00255764DF|nr:uncharacterized protein LOC130665689 isoform X3 [Microplitis mediator]XP_057330593.1 uncharacterized protein LOC130670966 isoform X2 [Microplitis mediator]